MLEAFKGREYLTREDLYDFYRCSEPDLNQGTFGWRIHDLQKRNVIRTLKRGFYSLSDKPVYFPELSRNIIELAKLVTGRFAEIDHCIWETAWLNEFSLQQSGRSVIIVEIEKGFEETLFYELKDQIGDEVFLNPNERTIDLYVAEKSQAVIVKRLLTRAPLRRKSGESAGFIAPTLEKILVDLFSEEKLLYFILGSELVNIFENAISSYNINFTRLFSYAKRRDREQDIRQFLTTHMKHLVKDIFDD